MEFKNLIVGREDVAPMSLTPHFLNFRSHNLAQRKITTESLNELGFVGDIIANKRTNHILNGHLRQELAIAEDAATIPVTWVDVDEATELKILAFFDRVGEMAEIDPEALNRAVSSFTVEKTGGTLDTDLGEWLATFETFKKPKRGNEESSALPWAAFSVAKPAPAVASQAKPVPVVAAPAPVAVASVAQVAPAVSESVHPGHTEPMVAVEMTEQEDGSFVGELNDDEDSAEDAEISAPAVIPAAAIAPITPPIAPIAPTPVAIPAAPAPAAVELPAHRASVLVSQPETLQDLAEVVATVTEDDLGFDDEDEGDANAFFAAPAAAPARPVTPVAAPAPVAPVKPRMVTISVGEYHQDVPEMIFNPWYNGIVAEVGNDWEALVERFKALLQIPADPR